VQSPLSFLTHAAGFVLAAFVTLGAAAAAQDAELSVVEQRACTTTDATVLRECARSCFFACRDRDFRRENAATGSTCNDLMVRKRRDDTRACRTRLAEVGKRPPEQAPPSVPQQPPIAANHAETLQRCNASYPGVGDSIIPVDGESPPKCFRSFLNLECRFQGLATRSYRFNSMVDVFQTRGYGTRKGTAMCELQRSIVENDFKAANQIQTPITEVKADFEREFGCLHEFREWLRKLSCAQTSGEKKSICDERNASVRDLVNRRLGGTEKAAEQLNASLTAATTAVNDIRAFWGTYRIVCF
jgi:hypothetical protein